MAIRRLLLVLSVAAAVRAEADGPVPVQDRSPLLERPLAVEGSLGIGGPYGVLGVALDYAPFEWLALNLGAGYSAISHEFQVGFMPRLRLRLGESSALGLQVGPSVGRYRRSTCDALGAFICEGADVYLWDRAWWGNVAVSYENVGTRALHWRVYAGYEWMLNPDDGTCIAGGSGCSFSAAERGYTHLPYFGCAVGYAF